MLKTFRNDILHMFANVTWALEPPPKGLSDDGVANVGEAGKDSRAQGHAARGLVLATKYDITVNMCSGKR